MYIWCMVVYTCITGIHGCKYGNKGVYRVYTGYIRGIIRVYYEGYTMMGARTSAAAPAPEVTVRRGKALPLMPYLY